MNFRNSVSAEVIDRLFRLANEIERSNAPLSIWCNKYNTDRVPFYRLLPTNPHELWDLYTYRFMGLDPNIPEHHTYHHWLFDPKWSVFANNGHNLGYRIYWLLSEFDVPVYPIECRIDWRRLHHLYPFYHVHPSAQSFAYWSARFEMRHVADSEISIPWEARDRVYA